MQAGSPPALFAYSKALFQTRVTVPAGPQSPDSSIHYYDVTADGNWFLMNLPLAEASPPITVVLNWTAGLRK